MILCWLYTFTIYDILLAVCIYNIWYSAGCVYLQYTILCWLYVFTRNYTLLAVCIYNIWYSAGCMYLQEIILCWLCVFTINYTLLAVYLQYMILCWLYVFTRNYTLLAVCIYKKLYSAGCVYLQYTSTHNFWEVDKAIPLTLDASFFINVLKMSSSMCLFLTTSINKLRAYKQNKRWHSKHPSPSKVTVTHSQWKMLFPFKLFRASHLSSTFGKESENMKILAPFNNKILSTNK